MSSWNVESLRKFVEAKHSDNTFAIENIKSIDRAIDIFRYHFEQAKSQNDLILADTPTEQMRLIFPPEDKREELWKRKLAIQANTQACIHSARSIHDLFAQLINSLLLSNPIAIHHCDVHKVTQKIEDIELKKAMSSLLDSYEFQYVNAFVNTIKHRNLVDFGASVSLVENKSGVQFKSFKFNDILYEKMWVEDVLILILEVKNTVVTAGPLLNKSLGINNV